MKRSTCNQCFKQLKELKQYKDGPLYFCENLKCPNFALVQIPEEEILGDIIKPPVPEHKKI